MPKKVDLEAIPNTAIIKSFYMSQGCLFIVFAILYFIFRHTFTLNNKLTFNFKEVVFLGLLSGVIVALLELLLDKLLPKHWLDDGGINRRIFEAMSMPHIFLAMLIVAGVEELLFRGVIQSVFGLWPATIVFTLLHFRYLRKPLMFIIVFGLGLYLGWLYHYTGSLWPSIACHYVIDVFLGVLMKKEINDASLD
ncbi:membrane protease YdiL (CAAX protease family) [Pullulanibacillus pueri]|uniref:CAAX prenyl protease 2/Lysostaphin resistance protein A-like domain-containing protein n=1 Tax=Pullulanibacillus pueri TaxID=1437324 RepID=A0A8J2ZUE8_9BACL|nr:CPBP family intramembrane glutamic endopeptidase [Pullulanibacillus pueri]MBM7681499.1 membrane protease YdiL (CAAX protease family) [Pullulanibacillus pueri]GGH79124.1 hypothetical protein GCM10007096_13590 [Pullulanibacillus pueri]